MALGWGFENRQVLCGQVQRGYRIPISSHTNTIPVLCRGRKGLPGAWVIPTRVEKGRLCPWGGWWPTPRRKEAQKPIWTCFPGLTPMPITILRILAYVPETSPGIRKFHRSVIKESFPNSLGQGLVSPHANMLAISKYLLSAWSKVSGGPPGPCLLKTDHKGQQSLAGAWATRQRWLATGQTQETWNTSSLYGSQSFACFTIFLFHSGWKAGKGEKGIRAGEKLSENTMAHGASDNRVRGGGGEPWGSSSQV